MEQDLALALCTPHLERTELAGAGGGPVAIADAEIDKIIAEAERISARLLGLPEPQRQEAIEQTGPSPRTSR
jgi:hypothetical protein